jgi:hypothetical protein
MALGINGSVKMMFGSSKRLDDGSLPMGRVVCRAIEIGTAERIIAGAEEHHDRNSRQSFLKACDQVLPVLPRCTMSDHDNSNRRI